MVGSGGGAMAVRRKGWGWGWISRRSGKEGEHGCEDVCMYVLASTPPSPSGPTAIHPGDGGGGRRGESLVAGGGNLSDESMSRVVGDDSCQGWGVGVAGRGRRGQQVEGGRGWQTDRGQWV